jgi:HlyD family secretion protein
VIRRLALAAFLFAACGSDPARLPALGTLERDRLELVAESDEPVVAIDAYEGARVAKGDVVVQLDESRIGAQLARAQAQRDEAAARLAEVERGPRHERVREGRARLAGAESSLANASREVARAERLAAGDIESRARLDAVRMARDVARAERDAARAALQALETGSTDEELARARSALAGAEAGLADVRIRLERLAVRAPSNATVETLPFELGERPRPGAVVAVLLADGPPYARVYVPQPVRVRIGVGSRARVRIAGREGELAARVRWVAHDAAFTPYFALTQRDRGRLAYLAEVDIEGADSAELPTGVPVEVEFE